MRYFGVLLFLIGCTTSRYPFEPMQRVSAISDDGQQAAIYELVPQASRWGNARVSTRGIYRAEANGEQRWLVQFGVEIENTGASAVRFSGRNAFVELTTETGVVKLGPDEGTADAEVASGSKRSFELFYQIPPAVSPARVQRFTLVWALEGVNRYEQRTEFRRLVPRAQGSSYCDNRPFDDFCDPYFYGIPFYVHTVDHDDRPTPPNGGGSSGGSSGGSPSPSSFPKPRSRAD